MTYALLKHGKVVSKHVTRNEAVTEGMWAVAGEGFPFEEKDEIAVMLDLKEGHSVVGWSVARIVEETK